VSQPIVSVIVPTYNSAPLLRDFLGSFLLSDNKNFEIIINDDIRSSDDTEQIIAGFRGQGMQIIYLKENFSMAQGRKRGAEVAKGSILLHLDSDMKVIAELIGECIQLLQDSYDALVIPEESFGTTFWARCKWLEKKCYAGVEQIESLRCIKTSVYKAVGGHNEQMVFSEDKDLDLRVKKAGYTIGRTKNFLYHNEGELRLLRTLKKKMAYTNTANLFATEHPEAFQWQANIFNRFGLYLRNYKYAFAHPLVYVGLWIMKVSEFGFGAVGYLLAKIKIRSIKNQEIQE
jgi:GT2 family glycosyltransferase